MRRWSLIAVTVLALAGCGLPSASAPERIGPARVPYGLLDARTTTASPSAAGPATTVYLVDANHLVPAVRRVTGLNVPAEALRALLRGPTASEGAAGIASDIPSQTRLFSLDLNGSVAAVDLSTDFGAAGGSQQVLAVAQIVYTLTASKLIDAVTFSLGGKPIEVPDGSGSLSTSPRTRADYRAQAPAG